VQQGWAGRGSSLLGAARRVAGAVLPLPGTCVRTRRCLLRHRTRQHGAKLCPCKPKAGWWVPFVLLLREIEGNPRSATKPDAEQLEPIIPPLDSFRAIYKHWLINPSPHGQGKEQAGVSPPLFPPPICRRTWAIGSSISFLQVTAARSGHGCVHLMPREMARGNAAKQGMGEDHSLGSGERFVSSTPCCRSY